MGWAIKRADGTYRCWNANAKDDVIQPGEVWEFLTTPPLVIAPQPPNPLIARIDAVMATTTLTPELRAVFAAWKAQL